MQISLAHRLYSIFFCSCRFPFKRCIAFWLFILSEELQWEFHCGGALKPIWLNILPSARWDSFNALFSSLSPCMGQQINLHCCIAASETFYEGGKSAMKTLFFLFLSQFTKSGSNPLSVVGGNLGNEVLRKWMKGPSDHTFFYIGSWNGHKKFKGNPVLFSPF